MRVQSARDPAERSRPLSSRPRQHQDKTEFLQRVYYNPSGIVEKQTFGKNKPQINSLCTSSKNIKHKPSNQQKKAQFQQNILLKKKVHMMETKISQLNSKMIVSKTSKMKKMFNFEFQNQNLWPEKSSYLVTGVKNQYEKLQIQYQEKCEQLAKIKRSLQYTSLQQMITKHQEFQTYSNNLLKKNLQLERNVNTLRRFPLQFNASSQRNQAIREIGTQQDELDRMAQKLREKKEIISKLYTDLENETKRTKFNERLAQKKDNELHSLNTQKKKWKVEKQNYVKKIQELNSKIIQIESQNNLIIKSIREEEQRKANIQRQKYSKNINEKDQKIYKLEKQVAYLTTLVSYWKPLDGQRRQTQSPPKKITVIEVERKADDDKNRNTPTLNEGLVMLSRSLSQRQAQIAPKPQLKPQTQSVDKPRQQKRADIRRSNSSRKVRQVRPNQVQDIGQLLRYRLIAKRISIDSAKDYFTSRQLFNTQLSIKDDQQESILPWESTYITMRQTYDILINQPFCLSQTQAELFSRYLIQDVQNDWIYCDWNNENKRNMVKSILKNIVKEYDVKESLEEMEVKVDKELQKYKQRVSARLQQQYKDGFISKRRLVEVLGHQLSQPVLQFIIGKLASKTQSLDRLNYTLVF